MLMKEPGKALGDERVLNRFRHRQQENLGSVGLGDEPGPVGCPPTGRRQINSGDQALHHADFLHWPPGL
jgi:hypothetical protein